MWRVYNLHHTSVFTYSHANTPLGQSERAYYLSNFIKWSTGHCLLGLFVLCCDLGMVYKPGTDQCLLCGGGCYDNIMFQLLYEFVYSTA